VRRVYVFVEGQTEESFVKSVLAETLWRSNVDPTPILLGRPGQKGGRTSYARVKRDIVVQLKQDTDAYCSMMIDLYGLGHGFPGQPPPGHLTNLEKVRHIEQAVKKDICQEIPNFRPDIRFVPYLQLHEYEALLFSDPVAFARGISRPNIVHQLQAVREAFESPEDINDDLETAPSKRIVSAYPGYRKVIEGTEGAAAVGIRVMREQCQHFREWIAALEALGSDTNNTRKPASLDPLEL
jgi:hypothetical protein